MSAQPCGCDPEASYTCREHDSGTPLSVLIQEHRDRLIWRHDRLRIAEILATFYRAPLSMSSVQPILMLAEELNPNLKERA